MIAYFIVGLFVAWLFIGDDDDRFTKAYIFVLTLLFWPVIVAIIALVLICCSAKPKGEKP